jgi:hypothetical protein
MKHVRIQYSRDRSPWMEYMLQEGLLFKGSSTMYPKVFNEGQSVTRET